MKLPLIVLILASVAFAQQSTLSNKDVIELVKGGMSEDVVLSKIKSSNCGYDTSSKALIELKDNGVSSNIILAVLNCSKPEAKSVIKNDRTFTLTDAVGKKRFFVDSEDEQSELQIIKELQKRGFESVNNRNAAELIVEYKIDRTDSVGVGSVFSIYQTRIDREWGKISVYLKVDNGEYLIYAKSKVPSFMGKPLHKQAGGLAEAFAKELNKAVK